MLTIEEAGHALSINQWSCSTLGELTALYTIAKNRTIKVYPVPFCYILNSDADRIGNNLIKTKYKSLSPEQAEIEYIKLAKKLIKPFIGYIECANKLIDYEEDNQ